MTLGMASSVVSALKNYTSLVALQFRYGQEVSVMAN